METFFFCIQLVLLCKTLLVNYNRFSYLLICFIGKSNRRNNFPICPNKWWQFTDSKKSNLWRAMIIYGLTRYGIEEKFNRCFTSWKMCSKTRIFPGKRITTDAFLKIELSWMTLRSLKIIMQEKSCLFNQFN